MALWPANMFSEIDCSKYSGVLNNVIFHRTWNLSHAQIERKKPQNLYLTFLFPCVSDLFSFFFTFSLFSFFFSFFFYLIPLFPPFYTFLEKLRNESGNGRKTELYKPLYRSIWMTLKTLEVTDMYRGPFPLGKLSNKKETA